ncbi:MAG: hypothetical protein ACFFD2_11025 [Promethearchaeota archaeon]
MKNLKTLELDRNPWDSEWEKLVERGIPAILEFCRKKIAEREAISAL